MLSVRERFIWNKFQDDKLTGLKEMIPGKAHFVVPTTAYAAGFAVRDSGNWARNYNGFVYDSLKLAHDACVDGRGDAIVLLPGTHTVSTASIAMNKAGVKIFGPEAWMGLDCRRPSAVLTTNIAGDEILNVTAPDCGLIGVTVQPITASDAIDLSAAADQFLIDLCHFDLYTPAVNIATAGLTLAAADYAMIRRSLFVSDGAQGLAIVATGSIGARITDCRFLCTAGTWAAAILCGAATSGLLIDYSDFDCYGTAITAPVDGTGATIARGVSVQYCNFGNLCTVPVDNFDANEAELNECYKRGVGGGTDGGTKIVAIT